MVCWIAAEQAGLIGEQFAALADVLGCSQRGAGLDVTRHAVLNVLRETGSALLVFDNADSPVALAGWLPGGHVHVVITTRAPGWAEIAAPVEVGVFARPESVAILRDRVPDLPVADAERVATALGDLPLAIAQAAGYMADTGIAAAEYTGLLSARAGELLDQAQPSSHPQSLAAVTQLTVDRLRDEDPAAAELAVLCAFLAPEPVPADWFPRAADLLPTALARRAADPVAWRQVLARIGQHALARIDRTGLQMHRLTQAMLRDRLSPDQAAANKSYAEVVLAASSPGNSDDPAAWPKWEMPHLLAVEPGGHPSQRIRVLACDACWYLQVRGDARSSHDLSVTCYRQWRERLGPDHQQTLVMARILASALRRTGRYAAARGLDEDCLVRMRRLRGNDHPDTMAFAHGLALDLRNLREVEAARDLDHDKLRRRRRVLGDDHPDTLASASNLAIDLRELGDPQAAHNLDQDTLTRRTRVLGGDHPDTLDSANNLAIDLRELGETH